MNNEVLDPQVNNVICEGYSCIKEAATKINVKVGQLGSISLDLCANCAEKFHGNDKIAESFETAGLKQKIARNEEDERRYMEAVEE